jgi:hypothetical protein
MSEIGIRSSGCPAGDGEERFGQKKFTDIVDGHPLQEYR